MTQSHGLYSQSGRRGNHETLYMSPLASLSSPDRKQQLLFVASTKKKFPFLTISTRTIPAQCATRLQSGHTGDNLAQFGRNDSLSQSVVLEGHAVDHIAGVLGGAVHGDHTGSLL